MKSQKNRKRRYRPDSQLTAYAAIKEQRTTEFRKARTFFQEHPSNAYSRADLCDILNLPINHVTRIVCELVDAGIVRVVDRRMNPRSGVHVEVLQLLSGQETNGFVEVNRKGVQDE